MLDAARVSQITLKAGSNIGESLCGVAAFTAVVVSVCVCVVCVCVRSGCLLGVCTWCLLGVCVCVCVCVFFFLSAKCASFDEVFALGKADAAVNLGDCKSIGELQDRTRKHLLQEPPLKLLEGMGWDQDLLGRTPNKHDLDACIPDTPAVFYRRCHHVCVLNSAALRKCSITSETPDPDGGVIERDCERQPTGILKESALTLLLENLKEEEAIEQEKATLLRGLKLCVENGVTFVQSNDGKTLGGIRRPYEAYASLADEGKLPCRVFLTVEWQAVGQEGMPKAGASHPSGLLSCDRAKIWTDGGLGASTAALLEPYADNPSNSGVMQMTRSEIDSTLVLLKEHGFRVEAHAIGDRAATELIDAFEKLMPGSQRPVLTHCQFLNRDLVDRMSRSGIIANVQPQFVPSDLPIIKSRVGEGTERFRYAYVWKTLMRNGVRVAGGSDAPVEAPTPLIGMADAMEHALFESAANLAFHSASTQSCPCSP